MEKQIDKPKQSNEHRVVLVTGSTSGIGLAIAEQLAGEGFQIAFHSKSSRAKGEELVSRFENSSYHQADFAHPQQAKVLIKDVLEAHGRLDVLINNAGISKVIPHTNLKEASLRFGENCMKSTLFHLGY